MLKTYRIIPLVFILFLFGFTLITVAPVIAEEQWNPSMGMCHNSRPCIKTNQCGDQCAVHIRESKGWLPPAEHKARMAAQSPEQVSTSPSEVQNSLKELKQVCHDTQCSMCTDPITNNERPCLPHEIVHKRVEKAVQKLVEQKKQDDSLKWHVRNMIGIHAEHRCNLQLRMEQSPLCARVDALYNRLVGCQKNGGSTWEKCFRDGLNLQQRNTCGRYCWCAIGGLSNRDRQYHKCRINGQREGPNWKLIYYYSGTYWGNWKEWQYKGGGWSKVKK